MFRGLHLRLNQELRRYRLLRGATDGDDLLLPGDTEELRQQVELYLEDSADDWPLPLDSVARIKAGACARTAACMACA